MNFYEYILIIIASMLGAVLLFIGTAYVFFKYIYLPYKHRSRFVTATELFETMAIIIKNEIQVYEKNVFNKLGALTNSSFENYYQEITRQILDDLSPDFYFRISFYMKEEAVVSIICRTVRNYLTEKVLPDHIKNNKSEELE